MYKKNIIIAVSVLCSLFANLHPACAQGTAFTYQGRLNSGANPVAGTYDMSFTLYAVSSGGSIVAGPVTNSAVAVTNGLFTVLVDFGAGVFTGGSNWLSINVRTNGGTFSLLTPRQQLTPAPNAIYAETASASGLSGTIPAGNLGGTYSGALNLNNAGNSFTGSGVGLTGLNASQLASGTVPDVRLSPNVALLNRNQTFTATNIFASGGGAGRLIVNNTFTAVDTNLFTGLSLQYDATFGESALMSSYNDGTAYLSFYTKPSGGLPVTKQVIISAYGTLAIDQGNNNSGTFGSGSLAGVGLSFGANSGEGIASKRTAGGNQYGLDFYTGSSNRLSVLNSGTLSFSDPSESILFPATSTNNSPMIEMFASGTQNYDRMVIAHSPYFPNWGLQYQDSVDRFNFLSSGTPVMSVNLGSQNVGIGVTSPNAAALEVASGDVRIDNHDLFLTSTSTTNNGYGLGYRSGYTNGITTDGPFLYGLNGGCLGGLAPTTTALSWDWNGNIWVNHNCSVGTLTIRGGADLAEPFKMSKAVTEIPQGAVVVIDDQNPGQLKLSESPYDTRVAGVVSGANGVNPGIQMHQDGVIEGGKNVALTGRVYVQADASNGAIHPGDMLTTSSTPGHAMKVSDHAKAAGAILGKAMTGLSEGKGLVLVLVTLQ